MSERYSIKINEGDLQRVQNMLDDFVGIPDRVTVRALNKTLTGVRTDASAAIREIITAKKAAVDETFKLEKASTGNLRAAISSIGKPLALIDYSSRQTAKGVSVQVRKDRSRKVVSAAFIAKMNSSHQGVFWREYHGSSKKPKNADLTYGQLPRSYRLKIKERFGPRVPDIMGNEPVMKTILAQAEKRLHDNLEHETDYEMSKHK